MACISRHEANQQPRVDRILHLGLKSETSKWKVGGRMCKAKGKLEVRGCKVMAVQGRGQGQQILIIGCVDRIRSSSVFILDCDSSRSADEDVTDSVQYQNYSMQVAQERWLLGNRAQFKRRHSYNCMYCCSRKRPSESRFEYETKTTHMTCLEAILCLLFVGGRTEKAEANLRSGRGRTRR